MGTRNLTVVVMNKKIKVAQYGQWDGYLDGAGLDIADFIKKMNLPKFKAGVAACSFITQSIVKKRWIEVGADPKSDMVSMDISQKFDAKYPELSRDTGNKILKLIQKNGGLQLVNQVDFAADSLMNEWTYVLDLDNEVLEIYKGFNTKKLPATERFAFLQKKVKAHKSSNSGESYYPVKLVTKIPFAKVSKAAINKLNKELNKDDEDES